MLTVGPCLGHLTAVFHLGSNLRFVDICSWHFRRKQACTSCNYTMIVGKKKFKRKFRRYFKQWDCCWSWRMYSYLLDFVCRRHLEYVVTFELSTNWKQCLLSYGTTYTIPEMCNSKIIPPPCLFMSLASLFIFCHCGFLCRSLGVLSKMNWRHLVRIQLQICLKCSSFVKRKRKEISIIHHNEWFLFLYFKVSKNSYVEWLFHL